ncbi:MAG: hypothetical protein LLG04_18355 [Parachlamydia sp.]|nr:hypothetical protein [Parachlamydia sp.]
MRKVTASGNVDLAEFLSHVSMWPGLVVSRVTSLARKVKEFVGKIFWPKVPYHPTPQEKAIAAKVDFLKVGYLKESPHSLNCRRVVPMAHTPQTVVRAGQPADHLRHLMNHFVRREVDKARGAMQDDRARQALDALSPIMTGLGGVVARRQAALLQNIVLAPSPAPKPVSEPVQGLCEIGKQIAVIAFEEGKKKAAPSEGRQTDVMGKFLNFVEPHVMPFAGVMVRKIGEVLDQVDYASVYDESVNALMTEASLLANAHKAVLAEKRLLEEHQALQRVTRVDPRVKDYEAKLMKGEIAFRRLSDDEQRSQKETHVSKIKKEFPSLTDKQASDWAKTNIQIELYLRDFHREQFARSAFCANEVKEIFRAREQYDAAGRPMIIKEADLKQQMRLDLLKIADSLVLRLFPVLEKEFRTSVLPALLGVHFTAEEARVVMDRSQTAITQLWDLYLKKVVVSGVADLLELLVNPTYWDELLALDLLPMIQDQLLRQQFKMTMEADMKTYRPLLHSWSFGSEEEKSRAARQIKELLNNALPQIPLNQARVQKNMDEMLVILHQEQFLLRHHLESSVSEPRGAYFIKQIKKIVSHQPSPQDREKVFKDAVRIQSNGKLLRSWELLVVGKGSNKFDAYAQPLVESLVSRFAKRKEGQLDTEIFRDALDEIPQSPDTRYGKWMFSFIRGYHDHYAPAAKQPLDKMDLEKPLQKKISDVFTSVLEPVRTSMIDQIVALFLVKLGKEDKGQEKIPLDREKVKKLLFVPNPPQPNLSAVLSKEIETAATLTWQLLVNQVAPRYTPDKLRWVPFKGAIVQNEVKKMLTGQDPSHIQKWLTDTMKEVFGDRYVNLNRLHKVVDKLNPQIDRAIAQINQANAAPPIAARQVVPVRIL